MSDEFLKDEEKSKPAPKPKKSAPIGMIIVLLWAVIATAVAAVLIFGVGQGDGEGDEGGWMPVLGRSAPKDTAKEEAATMLGALTDSDLKAALELTKSGDFKSAREEIEKTAKLLDVSVKLGAEGAEEKKAALEGILKLLGQNDALGYGQAQKDLEALLAPPPAESSATESGEKPAADAEKPAEEAPAESAAAPEKPAEEAPADPAAAEGEKPAGE